VDDQEYYEKVHGGWIGRVAGSQLGAPLELRPYFYIQRRYCSGGKSDITSFVKRVDPHAVNDDEIYQIAGLLAIERHGAGLTAKDIAMEWDARLYRKQFTAERAALKNIRAGIYPPESAAEKHGNVYHDAIGGQMKADIWGLMAPNCPEIAAHYARIDGSVAHQGIGIDGEVFVAVMIANSFGVPDIEELIHKSLLMLPKESEYRLLVEQCLTIHENYASWRDGRAALMQAWNATRKSLLRQARSVGRWFFLRFLHPLHVLPNAGIIVLSLLYGQNHEDRFGRPLCLAAMMGYDTDCNCGNLGTVMGTIQGEKGIPAKWKDPLQDRFNTYVKGYESWRITDLSRRICDAGKMLLRAGCPGHAIE
jgi:ADP-ribosylglycohydrolase